MFWINIRVSAAVLAFIRLLLPESRTAPAGRPLDITGALAITPALVLPVYAISQTPAADWSSPHTTAPLAATATLGCLFALDVVADLAADDQALTAARAPPRSDHRRDTHGQHRFQHRRPATHPARPPIIILTSTDRTRLGARLNAHRFIAKADICAAAIARLARTPGNKRTGIADIPALPPSAPAKQISTLPLSE